MGNKIILESLKAVDNVDMSTYKDALNIALGNKKNTNIALSGSYGSGKSSIIESYKNSEGIKYRFLHISLAQYVSDKDITDDNKSVKSNDNLYERNLEGKILNQLLHQIKSSRIPQTIFKVKRKTRFFNLLFWSISIPVILLLLTYVLGFNKWTEFINNNFQSTPLTFLNFTIHAKTRLVSLGLIFIIFSVFIYKFTKLQINKGIIQKISVKGNEIEVLKESKESYFDKYLNDVIYLFENANADVIVFEDIDRYNNSKIFEKLKEINSLINQRNGKKWTQSRFVKHISCTETFYKIRKFKIFKKIEKFFPPKRKVAFLYLLKDDMFISKDRTKFFDMIIPVVPVIDASNSYEKFIAIFKKGNLLDLLDTNFLQKISLYVDDMRLLKNIYNEFVIYHKEINKINLNLNKLLAIITYKNIFPRDFSELQLSKGFVYSLLTDKKNELIEKKTKDFKDQLNQIDTHIKSAEKESLESINELRALLLPNNEIYRVNGKEEHEFDNRLEFTRELGKQGISVEKYRSWYGGSTWDEVATSTIFQNIEQTPEYLERKMKILNKEKEAQKKNLKKQDTIKQKIEIIKSYKLSQLVLKEDIENLSVTNILDEVNNFDEIKRNDYFLLLSFLIRNAYLDESYSDYMTYFYPNSLTKKDRLFLRSITDEEPLEYNYDLSNFEQIINRMDIYDFSKKEVWNFNLLNFMLDKHLKYSEQIDRIIVSLSEEKKLDFIKIIFSINEEKNKSKRNENLLNHVFSKWNNFTEYLLTSNNNLNNSIIEVALTTLDINQLSNQNTKDEITKYLNNSSDFVESLKTYSDKLIKNIEHIEVKFRNINFSLVEPKIADRIYSNNLYEINFGNLKSIFEHFYSITDEEAVIHKNYTLSKELNSDKLIKHIKQNINIYMKEYLVFSDNIISDKALYAYELINNNNIDTAHVEKYISNLTTILKDIAQVTNTDFWKFLIEKNKIEGSEKNLIHYYIHNENQWTSELVSFVNNSDSKITVNLNNVINQYGNINLFTSTVQQYNLKDTRYSSLVSSMKSSYHGNLLGSQGFPLVDVPNSKISILINNKIIEMNTATLKDIRKNYPNKVNNFIIRNLHEYINIIGNEELYDEDEILNVLDENNQIELAECITNNISIVGKNYSEELFEFILKNKFHVDDLNSLINDYSNYSTSIQNTIEILATEHLQEIIEYEINIKNTHLLKKILNSQHTDLHLRKKLFVENLSVLNKNEIKKYLINLEFPNEFLGLFQGKRPKIEITDLNVKILEYLKNEGWIYGYRTDSRDGHFYRANGKNEISE